MSPWAHNGMVRLLLSVIGAWPYSWNAGAMVEEVQSRYKPTLGEAMRKWTCVCAAAVLMLVAAGCGGSAKSNSSTTTTASDAGSSKSYAELRWGMLPFNGAIDWDRFPIAEVISIESLTVESLMTYAPDGKVKPGLASSVEQPNPTTYIYHLKSAKFSDGKPLTAADVVFSLDRAINGKESWLKSFWEDVASVSATDSTTVAVKLKRPSAIFQNVMALSGQVYEKAPTEGTSEKEFGTPGHMLIGTGPWKIDSYQPEAKIELSRNPYWTGPRQPAKKITINIFKTEAADALAMRSGAIDGTAMYSGPKNFADISGARQLRSSGTNSALIVMNTTVPPFNDLHVRRAIAYATDPQGVIDALYPGGDAVEETTVVPKSLYANLGSQQEVNQMLGTLPRYEFNLTKARQELAKSAYPHGFSTTLEVIAGSQVADSSAQITAADLGKIGINAKIDELTPAEAAAWNIGKVNFVVTEFGAIYADPESYISLILSPGQIGALNQAHYRNAEADKLITEASGTLNKSKRLQLIGKLFHRINSEVPYRPLYTPMNFATISEKYVYPGFSSWTQFLTPWGLRIKLAS
jgi:peptide/nickel transport system substrate-binding protein